MNAHQREWISVVASLPEGEASTSHSVCEALVGKIGLRIKSTPDNGTAVGMFRSKIRYFASERSEEESIEPLEPKEIVAKGQVRYEYPLYVRKIVAGESTVFAIAAPYVGLMHELVGTKIERLGLVKYAVPVITRLYSQMETRSIESLEEAIRGIDNLSVLRGGRVNIAGDPHLRAVVLVGDDVMKSKLYKHLNPSIDDQSKSAWLNGAVAKIGFWGPSKRRIVVQMDQFGNFKFRPGLGGDRLMPFGDLVSHLLLDGDAHRWNLKAPVKHSLTLTGEAQ